MWVEGMAPSECSVDDSNGIGDGDKVPSGGQCPRDTQTYLHKYLETQVHIDV